LVAFFKIDEVVVFILLYHQCVADVSGTKPFSSSCILGAVAPRFDYDGVANFTCGFIAYQVFATNNVFMMRFFGNAF
jgi:hypothetical protein